jgi:hypothetical protein
MAALVVLIPVLLLVLTGCATTAPTEGSGLAVVPSGGPSPPVVASPSVLSSPSGAPPTFCAGRSWPPYQLVGIPGITATARDRATIDITNRTDRTYYYRVAGWQPAQFETCRALGEEEVEEGPIAPGATVHVGIVAFADRTDVPITVAVWDTQCGEACQRGAPIGAMLVERSPLQPAAS